MGRSVLQCIKSVPIFSGSYFPEFELNAEIFRIFFRIKTPNSGTFHVVLVPILIARFHS